jgi:hypothetical protein
MSAVQPRCAEAARAMTNNVSANVLPQLAEYQEARELDEDTLAGYRRVLGEDHPDTLSSANSLAYDLRQLGEYQQARESDDHSDGLS